jgi:hypothetical protein
VAKCWTTINGCASGVTTLLQSLFVLAIIFIAAITAPTFGCSCAWQVDGPAGAVEVLTSTDDAVLKRLDAEPGMEGAYDLLRPGGKMRKFFMNEVEAAKCTDKRGHRYSPAVVRPRYCTNVSGQTEKVWSDTVHLLSSDYVSFTWGHC